MANDRPWTGRELTVFKRLLKGGHPYKHMSEMLGRSERALRDVATYYKLEKSGWYYQTGSKFPPEIDEEIQQRIEDWIVDQRLTAVEMARRLKVLYPPGLHVATVCSRIKRLSKDVRGTYTRNKRRKCQFNNSLMHQRRRIRKRKEQEDADKQTETGSVRRRDWW